MGRLTAPMRDARYARVLLSILAEPADPALGTLVDRYGAAEVVTDLLAGGRLLPAPTAAALARRLAAADPAADLARMERLGGQVVVPGDVDWPTQLDDLGATRPLALWTVGAVPVRLAAVRSVAVVGARAATGYGETVARGLAADLTAAGWTVFSGGAFGIDAAAHRGALAVGGPTGCVLACGVDVAYPRAHDALLAQIADEGVLVSESPPGALALRRRFLTRNRILAALTCGTVVVEAALRSGSLSTAGHAQGLQRPVLGVPGPVTSAMSAGVHELVRDGGADLVCSAEHVLDRLGALGTDAAAAPRGPRRPRDGLDHRAATVLEAVPPRSPAGLDRLVRDSGLPPVDVVAALGRLSVDGFVRRVEAGWVQTGLARTGTAGDDRSGAPGPPGRRGSPGPAAPPAADSAAPPAADSADPPATDP